MEIFSSKFNQIHHRIIFGVFHLRRSWTHPRLRDSTVFWWNLDDLRVHCWSGKTLVAVPVATMCKLLTKVSWTWNIYSGHVSESIHWLLVSTHLICQSNLNGMIGAHLTVWGWLRTCKNMLYSDDEHAWTQALLMWKPGNKSCNHNSMGPMGAKLNLLWLSDYHLGHFWDC